VLQDLRDAVMAECRRRGCSMYRFAKDAKLSPGHLSRFMRGKQKYPPTLILVLRICFAAGKTLKIVDRPREEHEREPVASGESSPLPVAPQGMSRE
jgi:transcriptional regulator with XRE-family HTH domain